MTIFDNPRVTKILSLKLCTNVKPQHFTCNYVSLSVVYFNEAVSISEHKASNESLNE
jgi:hypothetical protein